jgi:heme-degrading monooxygenase HmoA
MAVRAIVRLVTNHSRPSLKHSRRFFSRVAAARWFVDIGARQLQCRSRERVSEIAAIGAARASRSIHPFDREPVTGIVSIMITVGMNYHVIPGKQSDFEDKFAAVIGALRAAEGHRSSTLWKDVSDDASYLITSEWSEEQAFLSFIHSQDFKDVTSWGKEQILSGRPQHKIYKN